MKKIGLLTWHTYENYGTYLQWYALTKVLSDFGNDVYTINYIPRPIAQSNILPDKPLTLISHYAKRLISKMSKESPLSDEFLTKRHEKFQEFRKLEFFKFTKQCETASDLFSLNKDFDYFVCGSDQIWSPICFDSHYFLDFVNDKTKKIAYAPSIGSDEVKNPFIKEKIFSLIKDIAFVSIRENRGKELIKENCGIDVPVVLDPTLLLSQSDWNNIADSNYKVPENYILCYFLGNNEKYWKQVKNLSEKTKIPMLVIPVYKKDFNRTDKVPKDIGPTQFITLVKNASFVCTDSYHGSIFSFIYKKQFALFSRFKQNDFRNQNSRIDTLTHNLYLKSRRVNENNSLWQIYNTQFDYASAQEQYNILFNKSVEYLQTALNSASEKDIDFKITNTCCGCGACAAVCPRNAISIKRNEDGFLQSYIDDTKCVHCFKCRSVCPFYQTNFIKPITKSNLLYAVKSKNTDVLKVSSSGGISFELMDFYKRNQSSVTGCVYDTENLEARGQSINGNKISMFDLSAFQGSKYIQSNYSEVFKELKNLDGGIITGLPCQIAAVNNYLNLERRRNEFLLVDLICHGVPSQNLWEKYISESRKKFRFADNPEVKFRNKPLGWAQMFISLSLRDTKINIASKKDLFYAFFLSGNCYADSCYECNYRCSSCADIRIADYWNPKYYKTNKNGVSMCFPLTEKGKDILYQLEKENRVSCELSDIQDLFKFQQTKNFYVPLERKSVLEAFNSDMSLQEIKKKYLATSRLQQRIWKISSALIKMRNTIRNKKFKENN